MGSLIHGSVESQISAIVTVCWWVDWDWNWLPWQLVMTSTNLNMYFESMLGCSHWQILLVCVHQQLLSWLFLLSNDTYIDDCNTSKKFPNSAYKCQPVCCDLTWPWPLLTYGKNNTHINTGIIIYGHSKRKLSAFSLAMNWLLWLKGVLYDYFGSLKPDITYGAIHASIQKLWIERMHILKIQPKQANSCCTT